MLNSTFAWKKIDTHGEQKERRQEFTMLRLMSKSEVERKKAENILKKVGQILPFWHFHN